MNDDIQPKMNKTTEPHLDVSKEPQTMSMQHLKKGDAIDAPATLDKEQDASQDDGGRKSSLLFGN
ncbi:MAG TPA: hypothetical protein VF592_08100 [Sphingomonas sp.]|jgi:hypothetical protein|uniref:hypothetical protein n=1 Tax=Sphingomonas sp. TaxID=28214 RepID=UPI002EDACABF